MRGVYPIRLRQTLDPMASSQDRNRKMIANSPLDSCLASANGSAQPLYFKSGENHLFGWLHRPSRPFEPKLGVVICGPFGYESICAHRGVREFAEGIVEAGIPTLRFDYLGTR